MLLVSCFARLLIYNFFQIKRQTLKILRNVYRVLPGSAFRATFCYSFLLKVIEGDFIRKNLIKNIFTRSRIAMKFLTSHNCMVQSGLLWPHYRSCQCDLLCLYIYLLEDVLIYFRISQNTILQNSHFCSHNTRKMPEHIGKVKHAA